MSWLIFHFWLVLLLLSLVCFKKFIKKQSKTIIKSNDLNILYKIIIKRIAKTNRNKIEVSIYLYCVI